MWRKAAALAVFACGCGGKVIFVDGGAGTGTGGAGGSPAASECILGACGDPCTKCTGSDCFQGHCDQAGKCQPPDTTFSCTTK